jgi:hypothetical protein
MVAGAVLTTAGSGLLYTLDIDTGSGKWIGYQILTGAGVGLSCQLPIIVNQALVNPSDLASVSAVTLFLQTIGGAFWVSAGQSAFVNMLVERIPELVPNLDPKLIVATGASELHNVFNGADIPGILEAYMDGLRVTFIVCIALGAVSAVVSLFPKWVNLKGKAVVGGAA